MLVAIISLLCHFTTYGVFRYALGIIFIENMVVGVEIFNFWGFKEPTKDAPVY